MPCIQVHLPSLNEVGWAELLLDTRIGLGSNTSRKTMDPLGDEVTALTPDLPQVHFGCEAES